MTPASHGDERSRHRVPGEEAGPARIRDDDRGAGPGAADVDHVERWSARCARRRSAFASGRRGISRKDARSRAPGRIAGPAIRCMSGRRILALGVVIAARSVPLAVLAAVYMGDDDHGGHPHRGSVSAAHVRRRPTTDTSSRRGAPIVAAVQPRARACAIASIAPSSGLVVGFALLALKVLVPI